VTRKTRLILLALGDVLQGLTLLAQAVALDGEQPPAARAPVEQPPAKPSPKNGKPAAPAQEPTAP
jgi:hypothetical protein